MRVFLLSLSLTLMLAACGFQPVYKQGAFSAHPAVPSHLAALMVDTIPGRDGQLLQVALEDGLRPQGQIPASQNLRLEVDLRIRSQPVIIELDGRITRFNLEHEAHYRVYDMRNGETLHKDIARRISSYNVAQSDFSTFIGERDARERGLQALADQMLMQLAAALEPLEGQGNGH